MKKLKAAVVGVGSMGQHHARIYSEIKEVDLVGVCDLDVKRGSEIARKHRTNYFRSYKKLLGDFPDLSFVSVVVPTEFHEKVACDLLGSGVNVLLEKPIADNIPAAKRIIEVAEKNKVKLAIGHVERHNPAVGKLKQLIDRGKLGEIISVIARRVGGFPSQIGKANIILDLAVHDVDIINYLLNEIPEKVFIHKEKFHILTQEDSGEIFLVYRKAGGFVQINWVTPVKIRELSVTGTKGYAELNYVTQDLVFHKARVEKKATDFAEFVKLVEPKVERIGVVMEEPLKLEILDFIESVKKNKEPLVNGKEALKSLRVCLS